LVTWRGYAKVVKAEMKVLDGHQQETLSRMCVKLSEGDAVNFLKELMILRGENQDAQCAFSWELTFGAALRHAVVFPVSA
jgi:hypothetical protein